MTPLFIILIVLTVLSAGFAGVGFYAWRQMFLTFKMVCKALDEDRKLSVTSSAPIMVPRPVSIARPAPLPREKFLTKEERRQMIAEKANDPDFQKKVEEINQRRRDYLKQMKPSRRFNPGQAFKPGQPIKETEGLEPLPAPEKKQE